MHCGCYVVATRKTISWKSVLLLAQCPSHSLAFLVLHHLLIHHLYLEDTGSIYFPPAVSLEVFVLCVISHHPVDQDDLKSSASQLCCQVGTPQNCSLSSFEETGSRQGCVYAHPGTNVATVSEKQHPAKIRGSLMKTTLPFHISLLSQRQVQSSPASGSKNEYFGPPGLPGNQLIHLS